MAKFYRRNAVNRNQCDWKLPTQILNRIQVHFRQWVMNGSTFSSKFHQSFANVTDYVVNGNWKFGITAKMLATLEKESQWKCTMFKTCRYYARQLRLFSRALCQSIAFVCPKIVSMNAKKKTQLSQTSCTI